MVSHTEEEGAHSAVLLLCCGSGALTARLASCIGRNNSMSVQHLTFGVFRHPSFMGRLGIPFIFGPVGGGERVPFRLRMDYGAKGHLVDAGPRSGKRGRQVEPLAS
jgi:hypothetical protein